MSDWVENDLENFMQVDTNTPERKKQMPKYSKADLQKLPVLSKGEAVTLLKQIIKSDKMNDWEGDAFPDMLKRFTENDWEPSKGQSVSILQGAIAHVAGFDPNEGVTVDPKDNDDDLNTVEYSRCSLKYFDKYGWFVINNKEPDVAIGSKLSKADGVRVLAWYDEVLREAEEAQEESFDPEDLPV